MATSRKGRFLSLLDQISADYQRTVEDPRGSSVPLVGPMMVSLAVQTGYAANKTNDIFGSLKTQLDSKTNLQEIATELKDFEAKQKANIKEGHCRRIFNVLLTSANTLLNPLDDIKAELSIDTTSNPDFERVFKLWRDQVTTFDIETQLLAKLEAQVLDYKMITADKARLEAELKAQTPPYATLQSEKSKLDKQLAEQKDYADLQKRPKKETLDALQKQFDELKTSFDTKLKATLKTELDQALTEKTKKFQREKEAAISDEKRKQKELGERSNAIVTDLELKLSEADKTKKRHLAEINQLDDKLKKLHKEKDQTTQEAQKLYEFEWKRNQDLKTALEKANKDKATYLEANQAALTKAQKFSQLKSIAEKQVTERETALKASDDKINELTEALRISNDRIEDITRQLRVADQALIMMKTELKTSNKQLSEHKDFLNTANTKIDELTSALESADQTIDTMKTELKASQKTTEDLTSKLKTSQQTTEDLSTRLKAMTLTAASLKAKAAEQEEKATGFQRKHDSQSDILRKTAAREQALGLEVTRLQSEVTKLKAEAKQRQAGGYGLYARTPVQELSHISPADVSISVGSGAGPASPYTP